ncbi:helix-turn-helix domain-containing protein [Sinimarinibacterium flocculans]|uniref:helix-turn-helix domain-containing protein n=1 Tax=Sinimarinibacterium flocculans TaxID=985250 RepID=UPI00351367A0
MQPRDIKRIRERLGLSQAQFAQLVGVHAVTVSRWERGDPSTAPTPYQFALMSEFAKAAASREADQLKETLGALLLGAGIGAALYALLGATRKKP